MTQPLLEVQGLCVEFRRGEHYVRVVHDVSFHLAAEEALGLVGESGSGKSVTALSIMRLIGAPQGRIASGQIIFEGKNLLELNERQMQRVRGASIAMVFQDPMMSLNPLIRIGRQLSETLELHQHLSSRGAWKRAAKLLEMVGISDPERRLEQYPHELSGGMRQRVMIAIALSCAPKLLIADEPTTALDVTMQAQIIDLIDDLRRNSGTSVIWITHDFGVIARSCDCVNVMYGGTILESAEIDDLFGNPQQPYTRALLRSVPRLDEPRKARLQAIAGSPPEPSELGPGCPFALRCPVVLDQCSREFPPVVKFARLHESRCWQNVREQACLRPMS